MLMLFLNHAVCYAQFLEFLDEREGHLHLELVPDLLITDFTTC